MAQATSSSPGASSLRRGSPHPFQSSGRRYEGWTLRELKEEMLRQRQSSLPSSDLQQNPHHLGKRLEDVLVSLREVAYEFMEQKRHDEVEKVVSAALDIVLNICVTVRVSESFKAVAGAECVHLQVPKIDHENNLLFLQFRAALEKQQNGLEKINDVLLCLGESRSCPLSKIDITAIAEPVRSITCGHIFDRTHILKFVGSCVRVCPVIGCPGVISSDLVFEDKELKADIFALMRREGCEPTNEEDVVYVEVGEEATEEQTPAEDEEGVDYYFEYRQGHTEE